MRDAEPSTGQPPSRARSEVDPRYLRDRAEHGAAAESERGGEQLLDVHLARYGEIWGDVGRYGEIWGGMGRYGEI